VAESLIRTFGKPIAAPSANRSGRISATDAASVAEELGDAVDLILDGGACPVGVESTIIGWQGGRMTLLRPGGIPLETIEEVAGEQADRLRSDAPDTSGIISPGMLASHYAPDARLHLGCIDLSQAEAILAFGPLPKAIQKQARIGQLSETGDLREAAANLFRLLRWLDSGKPKAIHVMPIPNNGLGLAVCDRLNRAAAPR
jgi:L-threonylcarbamoyladenylate synthase